MQNTRLNSLYNRYRRKFFGNILIARVVFAIAIIAILYLALSTLIGLSKPLLPFFVGQNISSSNHRINILLLGIRGEGQDGPNMTDTMIFSSINQSDGSIDLVSIPRDLWSDVINAKINSAFQLGIDKQGTESGLILAKTVVTEAVGVPVNYAVVINFSFFTRLVDLIGGVEIDVPQAFDDYKYPLPGRENDLCDGDPQTLCRYEHLRFEKGLQLMDGQAALKYVRSRQSPDLSQGTDFARSKRQEQMVSAIKNKLFKLHPKTYWSIYLLAKSSVITDLKPNNFLPLLKILAKSRLQKIDNHALTQDNFLQNPPISQKYDYQWVLIPKNGNTDLIPAYFREILK